jgi:DNA-binding CsgD family transcriptional regulator
MPVTSAHLATDRQKSKAELLQELERLRRTVADLQAASTSALEQQLIGQRRRLEPLPSELALAEERERRRIATGLHDQIGQNLGLVKRDLDDLLGAKRLGELTPRVEQIRARLDRAIEATRSLTFEVSSPVLYELGLEAAVHDLGERMADRNGMRFRFETDGRTDAPVDDVGVVQFSPSACGAAEPASSTSPTLTAREREVLQLVAEGYSGRQIASKLHLSPKTVSTHRQHIMDKLGIHNAVGLTKYAIEFGLTSVETAEPS